MSVQNSSLSRPEGRSSRFCSSVLYPAYRVIKNERLRAQLRLLIPKFEGSPVYSLTIRRIYRDFHGIDVGLYTIGPCQVPPGNFPKVTTIGRYSSIYYTVKAVRAGNSLCDAYLDRLSCGIAAEQNQPKENPDRLDIGNDVFMGHHCVILPSVRRIGDGAVIGAQSIVGANALVTQGTVIPPGSMVLGSPAKVARSLSPADRELLRGWADKYVANAAYCLKHGINVGAPLAT